MTDNILKILFIGDVVGRIGRKAVTDYLAENKSKYDFVILNAENASHGFGLTQKNYNQLSNAGVDCLRRVIIFGIKKKFLIILIMLKN